jgi:hypothetical protein
MFTASSGYHRIKAEIGSFLQESGFHTYKTATYYRTTTGDVLQFLTFQKGLQSLQDQMTLNVVVQGLFSPTCSFDVLQPGGRMGEFLPESKDKWWPCDTEKATHESIEAITTAFSTFVLPSLNRLSTAQQLIASFQDKTRQFLCRGQNTFIDQGYIYLKAKQYREGLDIFLANRPGKVAKFKIIRNLIEQAKVEQIDEILLENVRHQKLKWKI